MRPSRYMVRSTSRWPALTRSAGAHQSNSAQFDQSAFQFAGGGGGGGNGNAAVGGDVSSDGTDAHNPSAANAMIPFSNGPAGLEIIASGNNTPATAETDIFIGSMVHASIRIVRPDQHRGGGIQFHRHADQTNNVVFDQSAFQMAGIGGNGGNGNVAIGGDVGGLSSLLGLIGSDVIATGDNSAGSGGDGHFAGSIVDLNIAIYAPINIAVAGPNSTADAHQTNNVAVRSERDPDRRRRR